MFGPQHADLGLAVFRLGLRLDICLTLVRV
jgi:hypothetical protein